MGKTFKINPYTFEVTEKPKRYSARIRKQKALYKVQGRRQKRRQEKEIYGRYYHEEPFLECRDYGALPEEQP